MGIVDNQTAIAINPNFARGHMGLGWAYFYGAGQWEQSLPHFDTALRLSPRDPMRWAAYHIKGLALCCLGRHDEAISHGRHACRFPDAGFLANMQLAAALAEAGQKSEVRAALDKAMLLEPSLSTDFISNHFIGMHEATLKSILDSLRKAGVPE